MAARESRRVAVDAAILSFRGQIDALLKTVGDNAQAMKSTAIVLSTSLDETSRHAERHAESAVAASSDASTDVKTAMMATDELVSSIAEISRQVDQTNEVVFTSPAFFGIDVVSSNFRCYYIRWSIAIAQGGGIRERRGLFSPATGSRHR